MQNTKRLLHSAYILVVRISGSQNLNQNLKAEDQHYRSGLVENIVPLLSKY